MVECWISLFKIIKRCTPICALLKSTSPGVEVKKHVTEGHVQIARALCECKLYFRDKKLTLPRITVNEILSKNKIGLSRVGCRANLKARRHFTCFTGQLAILYRYYIVGATRSATAPSPPAALQCRSHSRCLSSEPRRRCATATGASGCHQWHWHWVSCHCQWWHCHAVAAA